VAGGSVAVRSCRPEVRLHIVSTVVDRLREGREIAAVLRGRRSRAGRLVAVHVREGDPSAPARVAVVASRKVGSAVSRNRAKRLLREASTRVAWTPGTDVVLVARAACAGSRMPDVLAEVDDLAHRLGVVTPPVAA
jgi:ribonuclease P protein component